jgi:hypothetical protein
MKTFLALLLVLVFSACVAESAKKAAEELDIREATYRYQFGKNASGQQQSAKSYYLSLDAGDKRKDPDDGFIKRFADNTPPVKKVSECDASANKGVVDKKTGERGLIFSTGAIKWVSDTEVEVSGGYYEAGESSSGNTYYLKKVEGKWKVIKDVQQWIS